MDDHYFINNVVKMCYDDWKELGYEYIQPLLIQKDILTARQLSVLKALPTDFKKNERLFYDMAPTFGRSNFMRLIDVINEDYPHIGSKLKEACVSCSQKKENQDAATASSSFSSASISCSLPVENESVQPNLENLALSELQNNSNVHMPDIRLTGNECQEDVKKYITSLSQPTGVNVVNIPQISIEETTAKKVPYTTLPSAVSVSVSFPIWMVTNQWTDQVPSDDVRVNRNVSPSPVCQSFQRMYDMNALPRGVAFIINNVDFKGFSQRKGSNEDKNRLSVMFKTLGWNVTSKNNLPGQHMKYYLKKFSQHKSLDKASAMAVVILTHGMDDIFFGVDGGLLADDKPQPGTYTSKLELMQIFSSKHCKAMNGKPKWFILQACRGGEEDLCSSSIKLKPPIPPSPCPLAADGLHSDNDDDEPESPQENKRIPATVDMCFLFSSSKGNCLSTMASGEGPSRPWKRLSAGEALELIQMWLNQDSDDESHNLSSDSDF